jgi:SAM-dependent methyltransferase
MLPVPPDALQLDSYAHEYDRALNQGISLSGEDKLFFARGRLAWLARRLLEQSRGADPEMRTSRPLAKPRRSPSDTCLLPADLAPRTCLDFGCGVGTAVSFLLELLGAESIIGVDISADAIQSARRRFGSARTRFLLRCHFVPDGSVDLAFCNGVFHHIEPAQRLDAARCIFDALRPDGVFAFWENNPLNPATRYVMSRIPFDRDANPLRSREACQLLEATGFRVLSVDYLFIFPRFLRLLRPLEPYLRRWPLGTQYLVLCRKPV